VLRAYAYHQSGAERQFHQMCECPDCGRVLQGDHRRRKTFSTIVPTIETWSMSPIGTNTVTLSDFHESVPGTRSTPSLASPSAPSRRSRGRPHLRAEPCPPPPCNEATRLVAGNRQVALAASSPRAVLGRSRPDRGTVRAAVRSSRRTALGCVLVSSLVPDRAMTRLRRASRTARRTAPLMRGSALARRSRRSA
jgi:hypothetical protein